jgi:hypothetical protein
MFLDFFLKNSIFLLFSRQKLGSCPPPEKSLRKPMNIVDDYKKVVKKIPWAMAENTKLTGKTQYY